MRKAFHRSINRWDSCKSLILIDKRLEVLQENKREKRKYTKKDVTYWDDGGKSDVVKKYPRISLPASSNQTLEDAAIPVDVSHCSNMENHLPNANHTPNDTQHNYTNDSLKIMTVTQLRGILNRLTGDPVNKRIRKAILIDNILLCGTHMH